MAECIDFFQSNGQWLSGIFCSSMRDNQASDLGQSAPCSTACTWLLWLRVASWTYLTRQQKLPRGKSGASMCCSEARTQSACCSAASITFLTCSPEFCGQDVAFTLLCSYFFCKVVFQVASRLQTLAAEVGLSTREANAIGNSNTRLLYSS